MTPMPSTGRPNNLQLASQPVSATNRALRSRERALSTTGKSRINRSKPTHRARLRLKGPLPQGDACVLCSVVSAAPDGLWWKSLSAARDERRGGALQVPQGRKDRSVASASDGSHSRGSRPWQYRPVVLWVQFCSTHRRMPERLGWLGFVLAVFLATLIVLSI